MPSGTRAGPSPNGIERACRALEQAQGSLGPGRAPGQTERCGQPTAAQAALKSVEKQRSHPAKPPFFNVIGGAIRLHSGRCPPVAVALSAAEHQAMPGRPWPLQQPGQRPWQPLWPACHVQQPAWSSSCLGFECGCDSSPRALGMAGAESEGTPCTAGNGAFWTGFSQSHAGQFPSCDWAGGAGNRQLPMQRRVPSMSGNLPSPLPVVVN